MKTKVWLICSATLLISTQAHAVDPGYGDPSGSNRQFNVNPGNMMNGMFNPMHNFFGGSDRYSNDYYNYRYPVPPAYAPGYGYPGAAYPPVYPGYQPPPQAGGYAPTPSAQQPPAAPATTQPPAPTYRAAPSTQPVYGEKYRFRPLHSDDTSTAVPLDESPYQVPQAPTGYSATGQAARGSSVPSSPYSTGPDYGPAIETAPGTQERRMIFRPLDKPGYSQ